MIFEMQYICTYIYIYTHSICTTNCTKVYPKHVHQLLHICDDLSFAQIGCLRFAMMMNPILLIFETCEQKQHAPQLMNKNPIQNRGFDWGCIRENKILRLFPLYSCFRYFITVHPHYILVISPLFRHYCIPINTNTIAFLAFPLFHYITIVSTIVFLLYITVQ